MQRKPLKSVKNKQRVLAAFDLLKGDVCVVCSDVVREFCPVCGVCRGCHRVEHCGLGWKEVDE